MKKTLKLGTVLSMLVFALASIPGTATAQDKGKKMDPMQFARGAREWRDNCERCHNLRDPKEFSDSKWESIVSQMAVRANLPGQVERDIKVFLKSSN